MFLCKKKNILINFLFCFVIQVTIAEDESWLVTTNASSIIIHHLSKNGTEKTHLPLSEYPTALTFDLEEKKIYWSTLFPFTIFRANIDGTSSEIVFDVSRRRNGAPSIISLALDWITKNLYFALERDSQIWACDPSGLCTIPVRSLNHKPFRIALHPQSGTMVWTTTVEMPAIFKASMDGSNPTQIIATGDAILSSIAIDHALSRLYWVNQVTETVHTSDLNGANVSTLKSIGNTSIDALSLTVLGPDIYWFDRRNYSIKKCNKDDGSLFEVKMSGLDSRLGIAKGFNMYLMGSGSQPNNRVNHCANQSCSHVCVLTEISYQCMSSEGLIISPNLQHCEDVESKMLISTNGGTHVLDMATLKMQTVSNSSPSWGLSYDLQNSKIYWAGGINGSTILRSDLNGSGIESIVNISGRHPISSLAYDWIAHNIYYTNGYTIGVCDGSGTYCAVLNRESQVPTRGIALFPRSGLMFWNTDLPQARMIIRANMDGSSTKTTRIEVDPGSNLVIDNRDTQLYWWNIYRTIVTTDLDFQTLRTYRPDRHTLNSIAVFGEWLYWISDKIIQRCNKYDCLKPETIMQLNWNETVFGMSLFHRDGQLQDRINHCAGKLCSHICLLTPKYFRCICPNEMYLMEDSRTCAEFPRHGNNSDSTQAVVDSYKPLIFQPEADNGAHFGFGGSWKQWICANGTFVDMADLCNGTQGCPDGTDESQYCDIPCSKINLNDDGKECLRTPNGPQVLCPRGFLPAADKRTCEDVDECLESICENDCINTNGSYECRDFPETSDPLGVALAAVIPTIVAIALIGVATHFGVKYIQTKKILRKLTPEEVQEFLDGDVDAAKTADCGADKAKLMPFRLVLQPDDIIIAKDAILGSGQFGIVYRGFCEGEAVAVKTFKRTVEIDEFKAVLAEAKIMAYIGDHDNVVRFIGADVSAITDRKLVLVTELSPHGDLLGYLRKLEPGKWLNEDSDLNPSSVTPAHLGRWCAEIASGMQHLESMKIVHGDLAARNVLVFKSNIVKITDFGLSKQLYGNSEYLMKRQRMLPWKWCALELLTRQEFSIDSDIWAFGVTAWEIFSLGRKPYDQHTFGTEFINFLEQGNRLPKPYYATTGIYELLKECWNTERSSRPRFATLREFFQGEFARAGINNHVANVTASPEEPMYTNV